jgi:hypothetical protein
MASSQKDREKCLSPWLQLQGIFTLPILAGLFQPVTTPLKFHKQQQKQTL